MLDSGPDGALWEWDLTTDLVRFSDPVRVMMGLGDASLGSDRAWWLTRIDAADRGRVEETVRAALAGNAERYAVNYCFVGDDGVQRPVAERGFIVRAPGQSARALGVFRGGSATSDARSLAERVEEKEQQFRTFVESIPQLAWTADANGWIDFYNQRWYDYTGSTFEQMEGWGWVSVHDPLSLPRMLKTWRTSFRTGEPWEDEFLLRRGSDGMLRWHLSRAMPMKDKNGKVVRWFGTNTDVHDQKLAMQEYALLLQREQHARAQAEQANRAKDEFLAVLSHELRTPLGAIVGWTHLLKVQPEMPVDKRLAALERIERNAHVQTKLVEDLLDLSRIIAGKLALELVPVALGALVAAVVEELKQSAVDKKLELHFDDQSSGVHIAADAARLRQSVINLVGNAIKFSSSGAIEVALRREGDDVVLTVKDEGEGFTAEISARLFQRFQQADSSTTRKHGGLGLGLSIVKELVELQGGTVSAESPGPSRGATFTVRFPLLAPGATLMRAKAAAVPDMQVSLAGIRVLAVDDQPSARDVLAALLHSCGATVTVVNTVDEALRAFKLDGPDVIISDIGMPGEDGYALVEKIRALPEADQAATPIIALTAYASADHRRQALARGFDSYLAKPVDVAALSRAVAGAARSRLG